jgi:hypothetical protein
MSDNGLKKNNGLTLLDLINHANNLGIASEDIYLLTSDGNPIIEIDSDTYPDLWFLGDDDIQGE